MNRDEFIAMLMKDSPAARDLYACNLFNKFTRALEDERRDPIMSCLFKHCRICLFDNVWSFMFKTSDDTGRCFWEIEKEYNHLIKQTASKWLPVFEKFFPIDDIDRILMLSFDNPYKEGKEFRERYSKDIANMQVLDEKEKAIYRLHISKVDFREIGKRWGITRERIHQIIEKAKRKMEAFEKYGKKID